MQYKHKDPFTDGVKTEFNMALASLERLDKALRYAMECSMQQDIINWMFALKMVYREIVIKLNKTEEEDMKKEQKEIMDEYLRINKEAIEKKMDVRRIPTKLYDLVPEHEINLRKLANAHGLLMPDKGSIYDE